MRLRLILATALLPLALAPAAVAKSDYAKEIRNILTPGEQGSIPPGPNSTDQLRLYDALTPLFGNVGAGDLKRLFKPETFGPAGRAHREAVPMRGLTILRDSFDVPHITGKTRAAVEFGAGWVTAEDRGAFIEAARGPARIAALDVPGLDALGLANSLRTFVPSAQTEAFLRAQRKPVLAQGKPGRQLLRDVDAYIAGINAYYRKVHSSAKPWTEEDVVAISSLIGAVFGKGGGGEVANADFLASLEQRLGPQAGTAVFRDLREQQDADTPVSVPGRFPYEPVPTGPTPGSAVIDPGSLDKAGQRVARVQAAGRQLMSNALLVSGGRSASGHPLAVMGPQVGYYHPGFLMEEDLHGGGIDARGASFPGISFYVLLGRGKDYAWSATSSSSDDIDQFLEQLCNADGSAPTRASTSYLYKGRCIPMQTFDAGVLKGQGGQPDQELKYHTTVHGPVGGTVTVGGRPYAVATLRSTRGREPLSGVAFQQLNENKVRSARDFPKVMSHVEFTFNWFYADNRDIAMFSSGRLPVRAPGTDPSLPTLGTGRYDWRGFISQRQHPQAIDPRGGIIVNWNNKPALGWGAADNNWPYGLVHRVELFKGFKRKNRLNDVASVMNRAATQDLRAVVVWPVIARVLAGGPAPDALTQQAASLVTAWANSGGSRLDRNGDGKIDAPGAAVLDAAWPGIADAVLSPVIGPLTSQLAAIHTRDNAAGSGGSSYGDGWYEYVDKDLRTQLGERLKSPYSRRYCGNGNLAACRASLWGALQAAASRLAANQGPDPNAWRSDATRERIVFKPGLLTQTMRWVNRPTFQQVVEFSRHRPRR